MPKLILSSFILSNAGAAESWPLLIVAAASAAGVSISSDP